MPNDPTPSTDALRAAALELRNEMYHSIGRRRALADYLVAKLIRRGNFTTLSTKRRRSPWAHLLAVN